MVDKCGDKLEERVLGFACAACSSRLQKWSESAFCQRLIVVYAAGGEWRSSMTRRTACERLDEALAHIDDPKGEGARACLTVYRAAAQAAGDASDSRGKLGISLGPLHGAIVTIKDPFDVAGEVTRAGSKLLAEHGTPAPQH